MGRIKIVKKVKKKYRKSKEKPKEKVVTRCANCGKYAKKK